MNSKIEINKEAFEVIRQHGEADFPNECCGFLYGEDGDVRKINLALPIANTKEGDQRRRFEISPLDYMKAEQFAVEQNIQLLGIYHSHPNHPAIASVHDLAKAMPFFSYVIISVKEGQYDHIQSWKLYDEKREFFEEEVKVAKQEKQQV